MLFGGDEGIDDREELCLGLGLRLSICLSRRSSRGLKEAGRGLRLAGSLPNSSSTVVLRTRASSLKRLAGG